MLSTITEKCTIIKSSYYAGEIEKARSIIRDKKDAPILAAVMTTRHDYFVSGDKDFVELDLPTHITARKLVDIIEKE
ncbi:Uncharacterised protein [uncultured archaeon]|nr:Uncharacterised protein [uncultured archaeon]